MSKNFCLGSYRLPLIFILLHLKGCPNFRVHCTTDWENAAQQNNSNKVTYPFVRIGLW